MGRVVFYIIIRSCFRKKTKKKQTNSESCQLFVYNISSLTHFYFIGESGVKQQKTKPTKPISEIS